jgi:AraC-like DNA-binding protein
MIRLRLQPCFTWRSIGHLFSKTAEELDVYPDRVALVEQQREADPTLINIALALRAGIHTGDRLYGEPLSTALAVHLLREYSDRRVRLPLAHGELSREKLIRAIEYIQDQLSTDLTVAAIARSVNMSPDHFARLFKKSTGRSPYRYVIEARARKARDLLASGKLSIIEIAQSLGFADQSHLTRQIKDAFGTTPKKLLEGLYPDQDSSKEQRESPRALPVQQANLGNGYRSIQFRPAAARMLFQTVPREGEERCPVRRVFDMPVRRHLVLIETVAAW